MKYGLPDKKKYPMPDRDHVMSAIKFFNYVSPKDEKELARNIIARMREYGIKGINVGEKNRFGKYYRRGETNMKSIQHSAEGQDWSKHKYIEKIKIGDAWRYFYDQDELNAYYRGKRKGNREQDLARRYGQDAVNDVIKYHSRGLAPVDWDFVEEQLEGRRKRQRTKDALAIRAKNDVAAAKNSNRRQFRRIGNEYKNIGSSVVKGTKAFGTSIASFAGDAGKYLSDIVKNSGIANKKYHTLSVNKTT